MPSYDYEDQALSEGFLAPCGIDEAGRGPWAGPVTAAAVVIERGTISSDLLSQLDDSKKLGAAKRDRIFKALCQQVTYGVGRASVEEIDQLNILQATFLAMRRAVDALAVGVDIALIDGNKVPGLACEERPIVKGDGKSYSIAAASVIAKVSRDMEMQHLAEAYPGYGWERNAGYGTREHQEALAALGVTPAHRQTYAPIRKILGRVDS